MPLQQNDPPSLQAQCGRMLSAQHLRPRVRTNIRKTLTDHWDMVEAWQIWNLTVCLTNGARAESPGVIKDAARRFREHLTVDTLLAMQLDSVMGLVRDATAQPSAEITALALDRGQHGVKLANEHALLLWEGRFHYALGRSLFLTGDITGAHNQHQLAAHTWAHLAEEVPRKWLDHNTLYGLRAAYRLNMGVDVIAPGVHALSESPDHDHHYRHLTLLNSGRKGQRHFDGMDLRW